MLVLPEQIVASTMHGGSLLGNIRRTTKKNFTRKRLMALGLALGAVAAGTHHRRAGKQADLQQQLAALPRGHGHWDQIARQLITAQANK